MVERIWNMSCLIIFLDKLKEVLWFLLKYVNVWVRYNYRICVYGCILEVFIIFVLVSYVIKINNFVVIDFCWKMIFWYRSINEVWLWCIDLWLLSDIDNCMEFKIGREGYLIVSIDEVLVYYWDIDNLIVFKVGIGLYYFIDREVGVKKCKERYI